MIDKKEIHIIYAKHAWTVPYIEELGYKVYNPFVGNSFPMRIIREIWFRIGFPFKKIFYNKESLAENKIVIVYEALITKEYMEWIRQKCLNCRFILLYTNKVGNSITPDEIEGDWCDIWTCDKEDAKRYGVNLITGGGYFPQWKVKKDSVEYDVFYIGKDKSRLQKLKAIETELQEHGVKTMFYITWEKSWKRRNDGIHYPFLPYKDVLSYIGRSRAILHLKDGAQDGITLRIQESLIHKVKLITDDTSLVNYDFYNPSNIFILGKDDITEILNFLNAPYVDVQSEFFKHAFYDDLIEEITVR